jgi:hypothetical protein
MANEIVSTGITVSYEANGEIKTLDNVFEIPELGGDTEALEVTNLSDTCRRYTDGIINYGDSIAFKLYYDTEQFNALQSLKSVKDIAWSVSLPDSTTCGFSGGCSVKLDGVGINGVMTYTLNIKPNSEMIWG